MWDFEFGFEQEAMMVDDREDLIAVLRMRFGFVPPEVITAIYEIKIMTEIERLIIVAANVPTWELFLKDLEKHEGSFRIAGDIYNPLENVGHSKH